MYPECHIGAIATESTEIYFIGRTRLQTLQIIGFACDDRFIKESMRSCIQHLDTPLIITRFTAPSELYIVSTHVCQLDVISINTSRIHQADIVNQHAAIHTQRTYT